MKKATVEIDGHEISLTNLDKVLYPETGFTKGEVIDYYARIAPVLLSHLDGRPLTRKRYPNGVDQQFFFEKNTPSHKPDWVTTSAVWSGHSERTIDFVVADSTATIVWLAQLAALELHPQLHQGEAPDHPTVVAFDLDPGPPAGLAECCEVALLLRELFGVLGLEAWPKVSGSNGMQVYVPLNNGTTTYDDTKSFAMAVAQLLEKQHPKLVTSIMAKDQRTGKIFVDWSQNDQHKTTIAVYSMRARARPTVSTPVTWAEVDAGDPTALVFETGQVLDRVAAHGDLFAEVVSRKQDLPDFSG
ncbi:MAG: non-homologous end-joining DNA ligase [Acidimicrobiales bacterium]